MGMSRMKSITGAIIIILLIGLPPVSAQMADKVELDSMQKDYLGLKPADAAFSLIDLSRIHWSHSYSISFFSGGGTSGSLGMYTGSIFYDISSSLSLNLKLGIAHNPGSLFDRSVSTNAAFLPGVMIDYHPSDKLHISAGFDTYYGNPYG
jgi:hypothetical protein